MTDASAKATPLNTCSKEKPECALGEGAKAVKEWCCLQITATEVPDQNDFADAMGKAKWPVTKDATAAFCTTKALAEI